MKKYNVIFPHGIMFHHFHNDEHPRGQGSISAEDFENIILFVGPENIVSADEWSSKYFSARAELDGKVCITFDDSLRCQYDIARPVLEKYNIKAFFFVYSSVLNGSTEYLEIFRYFRSKYFHDFNDFFDSFMKSVAASSYSDEVQKAMRSFNADEYLKNFTFYSKNDKIFRYLRDHVLKVARYNEVMLKMIESFGLKLNEIADNLWMNAEQVAELSKEGHAIGLHSDSHPTTMGLLSLPQQKEEYEKNRRFLETLLSKKVESMSHPCNSYNSDTLELLKSMNLKIGFRANMEEGFPGIYEVPRQDHILVLEQMRGR